MSYRVKDIWLTIQGEGFYAGTPAVFVRLVGCNMWSGYEEDREKYHEHTGADCPLWCDTDFTKEGSSDLTKQEILAEIKNVAPYGVKHLVFTGGEPFMQLDDQLVGFLQYHDFFISVETNGTLPMAQFNGNQPDWITCSPKLPADSIRIRRIDELKLVVPDYRPKDYESILDRVRLHEYDGIKRKHLYVQPEDGPRLEEANKLAIEIVQHRPQWKISVQTHKVLGAK